MVIQPCKKRVATTRLAGLLNRSITWLVTNLGVVMDCICFPISLMTNKHYLYVK